MNLSTILEKINLKNKLMIGFATPLLLLVLITGTVFFSLDRLLTASGWVNHTYEAISLGDEVTSSLVNMETGLRGFLVAGKDEFLEPYDAGFNNFTIVTSQALKKVSDNPIQVNRIKDVISLKEKWIAEHVKPAIAYRREVNRGAAAAAEFTRISARIVGKEKFDGFRQFLGEIKLSFEQSNDREGLRMLDAILIDMINQETGQRGFLLSGKEESLEPFNEGTKLFKVHTAILLQKIKQEYSGELLNKLEKLIVMANDWRTQAAEPEINARREMNKVTRTLQDVTAFIEQGIGKKYMDQMRKEINGFIAAESKLIKVRNEEQQSIAAFTKYASIGGTLISLIIGGLITLLLTRIIFRQLGGEPREIQQIAREVAAGNDTISVKTENASGILLSIINIHNEQQNITQVIEKEVQGTVDAAKVGDLSQRINTDNKTGFYKTLCESINDLLHINKQVINDTGSVFSAMSRGNLDSMITTEYQGSFDQLKQDANLTVKRLNDVIEHDIQKLLTEARNGDLSNRIDLNNKEGFFKSLSENINELIATSESVVNDTVAMFSAMSNGDLKTTITKEYRGSYDKLKQDANLTVHKLTQVIEGDIQTIIEAARSGDISQRISLDNKNGFFETLSIGINDLMDVNETLLNDSSRVMAAMREGDLTQMITNDYQGAFDALKQDTNNTLVKLTDIINDIGSAANNVATGSGEIASGNSDLSTRTESQAVTLEETSSSMQKIATTIRASAESARNASKQANVARGFAQEGGRVVEQAIQSMSEILESSTKINNIIGAIDDIAFQTNLLALNAAVEAARAGEQGKGFAVVAVEVRNLSQRSASAAKEIKDLIQDSVSKAESGSLLVNESGEKLTAIVNAVEQVADMISTVDESANRQIIGVDEINDSLISMESITQQNAALVEEAAASSASMSDQAINMTQLLNFFTTNNTSSSKKG